MDETNKEVKLAGLISIVVAEEGPWYNCNHEVMQKDLIFEKGNNYDSEWSKIEPKINNTGLWIAGRQGINGGKGQLSLSGRMAFGNCKDEFYKENGEAKIVQKLMGENKQKTGLQKLSISEGMNIIRFAGIKHNNQPIITPGILNKNNTSTGGKTLWVGLQEDGKVKRTVQSKRDDGQGFVLIHNLLSEGEITETEETGSEHLQKIKLKETGTYYLWDPSYTHIKNGKYETIDGVELPWKSDTNLPFSFKLIK